MTRRRPRRRRVYWWPCDPQLLDRVQKRWVRRHQARHGEVIVKVREAHGAPMPLAPMVLLTRARVIHCACGQSLPISVQTVLGMDTASEAAHFHAETVAAS